MRESSRRRNNHRLVVAVLLLFVGLSFCGTTHGFGVGRRARTFVSQRILRRRARTEEPPPVAASKTKPKRLQQQQEPVPLELVELSKEYDDDDNNSKKDGLSEFVSTIKNLWDGLFPTYKDQSKEIANESNTNNGTESNGGVANGGVVNRGVANGVGESNGIRMADTKNGATLEPAQQQMEDILSEASLGPEEKEETVVEEPAEPMTDNVVVKEVVQEPVVDEPSIVPVVEQSEPVVPVVEEPAEPITDSVVVKEVVQEPVVDEPSVVPVVEQSEPVLKKEETVVGSSSSWKSLTVPQLKQELERRGLAKKGRKHELIQRLVGATAAEETAVVPDAPVPPETSVPTTNWQDLRVPELKAELRRRGLSVSGRKAKLVDMLNSSDLQFRQNGSYVSEPVIPQASLDVVGWGLPPPPPLVTDYTALTVPQLKTRLRAQNLPVSGNKQVLIARLVDAVANEPVAAVALVTETPVEDAVVEEEVTKEKVVEEEVKKEKVVLEKVTTEEERKIVSDVPSDDRKVDFYTSMTVPQLKVELRARGLRVSGKKATLIERLIESSDRQFAPVVEQSIDQDLADTSSDYLPTSAGSPVDASQDDVSTDKDLVDELELDDIILDELVDEEIELTLDEIVLENDLVEDAAQSTVDEHVIDSSGALDIELDAEENLLDDTITEHTPELLDENDIELELDEIVLDPSETGQGDIELGLEDLVIESPAEATDDDIELDLEEIVVGGPSDAPALVDDFDIELDLEDITLDTPVVAQDDLGDEALAKAARDAVSMFEAAPTNGQPTEETFQDWSQLPVLKLKEELKNRGLPATGSRIELIATLEASDLETSIFGGTITEEPNGSGLLDDFDFNDIDLEALGKAAREAVQLYDADDEPSDEALWEIEQEVASDGMYLLPDDDIVESVVPEKPNYVGMAVSQLKAELKSRGLRVTGKKADLIIRLQESD